MVDEFYRKYEVTSCEEAIQLSEEKIVDWIEELINQIEDKILIEGLAVNYDKKARILARLSCPPKYIGKKVIEETKRIYTEKGWTIEIKDKDCNGELPLEMYLGRGNFSSSTIDKTTGSSKAMKNKPKLEPSQEDSILDLEM